MIRVTLQTPVEKGFRVALSDIEPDQAFLVYPGDERYAKGEGIEAIGLGALAEALTKAG